jgi:hypothetical protein
MIWACPALEGGNPTNVETTAMTAKKFRSESASATDFVAIDETDRLIASDKVEGTAVFNRNAERLGEVYNFMVDKYTGQVAYAVMSFGGFLGIGERYYPLPWKKLTYNTQVGGFVVDVERSELERAPNYGREENPWKGVNYGREIYSFYGVPWYL